MQEGSNCPQPSNIDGVNINQNVSANVNFKCLQTTSNKEILQKKLEQQAAENAKNASEGINLPSVKVGMNFSESVQNLNTAMNTVIMNKCLDQMVTAQSVKLKACTITSVNISQDEALQQIVNCVQNDANYSQSKDDLEQKLTQTVANLDKGIFAGLTTIIIIIAIVIGVVAVFGIIFKMKKNPPPIKQ